MTMPTYDTYEYRCPDCRRVLARYAPYDTTPFHVDPDAPGRECPGVGERAIFLGRIPAAPPN
jgi:hypothetical protein